MRVSALLLVFAMVPQPRVPAQTFPLSFDDPGVQLDSVYPTGTWQVGAPQKVVFDSAYSAPNALVTDTLLPYPVDTLTYAEFHLPVWFMGSAILSFKHRMDIDIGEALGWVEFRSPWDTAWIRTLDNGGNWGGGFVNFTGTEGELTDSGLVFNSPIPEWSTTSFDIYCIAAFWEGSDRGGGLDTTMRFRFAFQGYANTNARDGWLIDDIIMQYWGPCNGIADLGSSGIVISPNPAADGIRVHGRLPIGTPVRLTLFDDLGRMMFTSQWSHSPDRLVPIEGLPPGPYAFRLEAEGTTHFGRIVVLR